MLEERWCGDVADEHSFAARRSLLYVVLSMRRDAPLPYAMSQSSVLAKSVTALFCLETVEVCELMEGDDDNDDDDDW